MFCLGDRVSARENDATTPEIGKLIIGKISEVIEEDTVRIFWEDIECETVEDTSALHKITDIEGH